MRLMAPELLRINRIDEWPSDAYGAVWIIRATTVEADPRLVVLRTVDGWKASICDRAKVQNSLVWASWRDGFKGDVWLQHVEPDQTKFHHDEAV